MYALLYRIVVVLTIVLCEGSSVNYEYEDIVAKTKVELRPLHIISSLQDIIVINTPIINCNDVTYQLRKPNGDILRKKIYDNYKSNTNFDRNQGTVIVKYITKDVKAIYPKEMYKAFNLEDYEYLEKPSQIVDEEENVMNKNDFIVGPLQEEDHGNWVLSVYCTDIDDEWVEMFQVITVELVAYVEMDPPKVTLAKGSTFKLSFLYPIKNLESCELTAPRTSYDRFFDRNRIELARCGYVVSNVTSDDEGSWRVTGVGRMVYHGVVRLKVID